MIFYMLITLIMSNLQGRVLKPFSCAQVQDNLQFIDFDRGVRVFFYAYFHSMNHMCTYLRDYHKIKFRMGSAQHFINEACKVV